MKQIVIVAILIIVTIIACRTDPIIIEVPGDTIYVFDTSTVVIDTMNIDTMHMDTITVIVEGQDLCNGVISFEREVWPLITSSCAYAGGCHDNISHKEGVRLETYTQIRSEVKPNNPNQSEIYKSLTASPSSDKFMPPSPALPFTAEQKQLIKDWINQGANNTTCNLPCDSRNTSFQKNIYPLLKNNCIGCHQTNNAQGNINLIDYAHIRTFALNGRLIGSIRQENGYIAMPAIASKLTDCQIAMINNWIIEGAQNN